MINAEFHRDSGNLRLNMSVGVVLLLIGRARFFFLLHLMKKDKCI